MELASHTYIQLEIHFFAVLLLLQKLKSEIRKMIKFSFRKERERRYCDAVRLQTAEDSYNTLSIYTQNLLTL